MADVTSGLFALGGVSLAELWRALGSRKQRRHQLEDRSHGESRETEQRWLATRKEVHADFLISATHWLEGLEQAANAIVLDVIPPDDLQAREAAVAAPAANLELLAGERGRMEGATLLRQLYFADACRTVYMSRQGDDELQVWLGSLEMAAQLRKNYITVARAELATEPTPLWIVDLSDDDEVDTDDDGDD